MPPNESPSVTVARRGDLGSDPLRTVVWVRGEHDITTRVRLSATIAQAARIHTADIVVDLSGVAFMDASTIGVLVGARNRLRARSRSLCVRAPSPRAQRVLDLCGLAQLVDEYPSPAPRPAATALRSWVAVPALGRGPDYAQPSVALVATFHEPARVTARRRVETAGSGQRRAPS